jgi:capsular polysaccharide biosynthesis protein
VSPGSTLQRVATWAAPPRTTWAGGWRFAHTLRGSKASSTLLSVRSVPHDGGREALHVTNGTADIEPLAGWVVTRPLQLEAHSISGHLAELGAPGLRRHVALRAKDLGARVRPPVLSLRMSGERNYFHAIVELLGGRLRLAEECGVPADTPLVVGAGLASTPFFGELQQLPALAERRWIVQDVHQLVSSERVYFAETSRRQVENFAFARTVLGVEDSDPQSQDRVLLLRSPAVGRTLANVDDVIDVARRHGFRPVDTARMPLAQQREIFSSAGFVVGIHGAGLTNLLFRQHAPLSLLEIVPSSAARPAVYRLLAESSGFRYRSIAGDSSESYPWRKPFRVDVDTLTRSIEEMLSDS